MINAEKIEKLLQQGEGITIEFKKAKKQLPSSLFESICAFLNRNGGEIVLGVTDDKTIEGIEPHIAEQLVKQISNTSNNPQLLSPSFLIDAQIVKYQDKTLVYILVPASSQVHQFKGKIYDRSADGDFELSTGEQLKQVYVRKSTQYSENTIYPFLEQNDFAEGIVERCRKIIRSNRPDHPWNELTDLEFFRTAGLYRKDLATGKEGFTMSALLLFGKDEIIQSALPHFKIDALLRRDHIERYDDRENIRCNIIEAYDKLMAFVAKHLPDKFYLQNDQRVSLRDKIFREVVANILIHREYSNSFPTSFIIYEDRLETKNANKAHIHQTLKPGNYEPYPKNPHIAQMFTQMGRTEELGTGIQNVFKYSMAYSGNNNIQFKENDVFLTIIPLKPIPDNEGLNEGLNEVELKILQSIRATPGINMLNISKKLGIPYKTIERHIRNLTRKNFIERQGSKKTGGYVITRKV